MQSPEQAFFTGWLTGLVAQNKAGFPGKIDVIPKQDDEGVFLPEFDVSIAMRERRPQIKRFTVCVEEFIPTGPEGVRDEL